MLEWPICSNVLFESTKPWQPLNNRCLIFDQNFYSLVESFKMILRLNVLELPVNRSRIEHFVKNRIKIPYSSRDFIWTYHIVFINFSSKKCGIFTVIQTSQERYVTPYVTVNDIDPLILIKLRGWPCTLSFKPLIKAQVYETTQLFRCL